MYKLLIECMQNQYMKHFDMKDFIDIFFLLFNKNKV